MFTFNLGGVIKFQLRKLRDMIQDTRDRGHDTGDMIQNTSYKRHHR